MWLSQVPVAAIAFPIAWETELRLAKVAVRRVWEGLKETGD